MTILLQRVAFTAFFFAIIIGGGFFNRWDYSLGYWLVQNVDNMPGIVAMIVGALLIAASHIFFERIKNYTYGNLIGGLLLFGAPAYLLWDAGWIDPTNVPTLLVLGVIYGALTFGWFQSARHTYFVWRRVRSMDRSDDDGNLEGGHDDHHH
jgi:hypothetical protein